VLLQMPQSNAVDRSDLPRILAVAFFARTNLNIAIRMAYPFLPIISRGLGVSLATATLLVTARSALGLMGPLFGPLSDRYGRRSMMLAGLTCLMVGGLLCFAFPVFVLFLSGFMLMGFGKIIFDPAMQAYLSDRVAYAQRGRVLGITELAWATANLAGLPAMGLLIEGAGWRAPFLALAGLGVFSALLVRLFMPSGASRSHSSAGILTTTRAALLGEGRVLAALAFSVLFMAANDNLFIVYGAWMETSFGLGAAGLGAVAAVIGVAELVAEFLSAALVDALGKKRAAVGGGILTAIAYVVLPHLGGDLRWATAGLFSLLLCFEFAIVSSIPLISELEPEARGTVMSWNVAALSGGRMVGALTGAAAWSLGGFAANGVLSALLSLAAIGFLVSQVREGQPTHPPARNP